LKPEGRAPVRAGAALYREAEGGEAVGAVTSGGFGVSIGAPVAIGYVGADLAREGATVFAEVRGKRLPAKVAPLPFAPARYKR
jgi:aminomethyltransferase